MPHILSLMTIDEPYLIERYQRALSSFGLKPPKLDTFEIDMTGWSPEVARALGDEDYLDPNRINRRFIILSPEQAGLPIARSSFSNTRDLMLEFFEKNKRVLYALTIKDVVFGEIEDNVFEVDDIDDLLAIEQVEFKIGTHEDLTGKTNQLNLMIDKLLKEPDAWRDDDMLNEMVEIVKQTGDIRDNALVPEEVLFRHDNFWTSHFGGTYVFNDERQITVVCDPSAPGFRKSRPWEVGYLDINDQASVYAFLEQSGRLQKPSGSWIERSKLLDYRKHMAAIWLASQEDDELPHSLINQTWVRRWKRDNPELVREQNVIPLIEWVEEQIKDWDGIDMRDVDDEDRFVLCRANPEHEDMALVNRLISNYLPFDFITRYEFNRPDFMRDKMQWSKAYAEFVETALNNTYLDNKERSYSDLYL